MKGTAKRGRSFEEDKLQAESLKLSTKDRAENLMIVDLLRNDLGKIAIPGTVDVPQLFTLERYPTLWTMTSTVEAKTPPQTTLADVFTALFPCGSITGAPKRKTMELIHALEQSPREAYCGTVGYLKPGGEAVFNVAIRTVIVDKQKQRATYGVGGGITWSSTSLGEYEEVITKAKVLQSQPYNHQLVESIRLEDGQYTLLDRHLERMKKTADYFGYDCFLEAVERKLNQLAKQHAEGVYKVRLLLARTGEITLEAERLKEMVQPQSVTLAKAPVNSDNIYLYHKTTERTIYEKHKISGFFDTLLWNERDELTEFTIGNVVLEIDGELVTPLQESGLLAGSLRAELLASGKIAARVILKEEVFQASAIWLVNSVRGWVKVELQ
jgi:para-aminobenzoate synthetase/4-amino-4-deoxychorismate lyase